MDDLDKVLSTEYDDYTLIRFHYDSKEEFYRIQREIRENEDNIFESWIAPGTDILDKKDVNLSTDNYAETASKTGTTDENNKDEYDVGEDI